MMLSFIYGQNCNIFSIHPNVGGTQEYELIEDKYFYQVFKELLPNKEVENSYDNNNFNCGYKYFIEFIFQSEFIDSYLNDYLIRENLYPSEFNAIYFLSEQNQFFKYVNIMINISYLISVYYFHLALGVFNHAFDILIYNNLQDCQNFVIIVFRINDHLLKIKK